MPPKTLVIGFWASKRGTGDLLSHTAGLTEETLAAVKSLELGDRLIMYKQEKQSKKSPDYVLKRWYKKETKERL